MIQALNYELGQKASQALSGTLRSSNYPTAANENRVIKLPVQQQPHHKKNISHDMRSSTTKLCSVQPESLKITKVFSNNQAVALPKNFNNILMGEVSHKT